MTPPVINKEKIAAMALEAERQRKLKEAKQKAETRRTPNVEKPADINERLLAMAHSSVQHRRNYEEWLRGQAKTKKCDTHAFLQTIDVRLGCEKSFGRPKETWQAFFLPCPKCERDSQVSWLKLAGVPSNMLHCTLDNWTPKRNEDKLHLATLAQFVRKGAGFIIIAGIEKGIGKTHLAVGLMREFKCGMFRTQLEFFEQYAKRFQPHQTDILERAKAAKLFVMDDFGLRTMPKDSEVGTMHSLFNHRYGEELPTIITSNESYDQICRDLGERMTDRLEEAVFSVIDLHGKSHRPTNRAKYGLSKTKKAGTV